MFLQQIYLWNIFSDIIFTSEDFDIKIELFARKKLMHLY